jgi:biopolymer transport protein ExbB
MKMGFSQRCLGLVAGALLMAAQAFGAEQAASVDELMQLISSAKISESTEHQQREAEFMQAKDNHQALLAQAKVLRQAAENRSALLERDFNRNEVQVDALRRQLGERLGSLQELFGHLTVTAGGVRVDLNQSVVSAQIPGRTAFVDELITVMSSDTKLPTIEDIEGLWAEMAREMAESGKVVKFPATVVKADGEKTQTEVVRIGAFNLVADGAYLDFNAKTGVISELPRQPDDIAGTSDLLGATQGFSAVGIDPSGPRGGNLLKALGDTPTFMERYHQGGLVGYLITLLGVCALVLAGWRIFYLYDLSAKVRAQLLDVNDPRDNNPLGRLLKVARHNCLVDIDTLELRLNDAVLRETLAIESGHSLLKILALVAPLLGLLGTVVGIILTSQQIALFGSDDSTIMAGGIAQALVTTVQGLCVAIPVLLLHALIQSRALQVLHILKAQSAAIVAESAES